MQRICYTYTTGSSALPDIYAQARGPQARWRMHIYIRQSSRACGISIMYHIAYVG